MQSTSSTGLLSRRWLIATIGLILLSTILFLTGLMMEHSSGVAGPPTSSPQGVNASQDPDGGRDETPSFTLQHDSTNTEHGNIFGETIFGINLENPWLVGIFVLVWLVLAVALLRLGRIAWVALMVVAIGSGVLDVGEVRRQLIAAHTTLATFAILVTLAHVALAVLALLVLLQSARKRRLSPAK